MKSYIYRCTTINGKVIEIEYDTFDEAFKILQSNLEHMNNAEIAFRNPQTGEVSIIVSPKTVK
jgi:hypothetical protein